MGPIMLVKDIFALPIERSIKGVIKVDELSDADVIQELSEYVLTESIERNLMDFLEVYTESRLHPTDRVGAWISGFFGSGKSHFAKILGHLLENRVVDGKPAAEHFHLRLASSPNESDIKALLFQLAANFENYTAMFQIKAEEDQMVKDSMTKILYRQFLLMQGFSSDFGIAQVEIDLMREGKYEEFKKIIEEQRQKPWEEARKVMLFVQKDMATALAKLFPNRYKTPQEALDALKQAREQFVLTPSSLATQMVEFVDVLQEKANGKTVRLIFIIDEMGQFIGDDSQKLLELQSIVEQFAVKGKGKLWLIVTSQERLDELIEGVKQKRADFVKIGDRFHTKLELTSENIEKVVEERMLKKRETHKPSLLAYYKEHAGAIGNIATLQNANRQLPACDADNFLKTYPLMPAQLDIIPDIFRTLRSAGQRFTPLSGSERSLLGVVQGVIIDDRTNIQNADIGRIATYDEIYNMVEHEIDTQVRRDIAEVERLLHYPAFSLRRILKALYLIQQLTWIPRSLDNLTRLLMRNIEEDFSETRNAVKGGLEKLMEGDYVVKEVDNQYQYLSGDKRKMEEEIKAFKPKHNDIRREARKILLWLSNRFTDIHYKKLAHIPIVALADEESVEAKKAGDVTLEVYSPIAVEFGDADRAAIKNQSYSDARKIWWLPAENVGANLIKELTRLIQVDTVVETRNKKTTKSEEEIAILREKQIEADSLRKTVESGFRSALVSGVIIYNGEETPLDGSAKDLNTIFERELNDILPHIYTKFDVVTYQVNEKSVVELLSQPAPTLHNIESHLSLFDEAGNIQLHSPVLNEVLTEVKDRTQKGEECDGRSLLEHFRQAPYGWDGNVTRIALSALFRSGDISIKFEGKDFLSYTQKAAVEALRTLTNFNKTEFIYQDTSLTLQERIEAKQKLDILFSYKGTDTANELSNAIVQNLGQLAAENKSIAVHCQYAQLPLKDEYGRLRKLCEQITEGANAASRIRTFLEHYDELETGQKYQQSVKGFVESEKLKVFESLKKFMALDDKSEISDEAMQLALEEINAVLANRAVISSWDVLVQNYTQALSLYRKTYTQSHEERFLAYQQAEQEICSSVKEQEVEPEKVDKLLKNWNAYLCEKLDWDETLFRCRSCGAPLSTINFHLKLVETNKQDVLKELRKTTVKGGKDKGVYDTDIDTKFVSLKELATLSEIRTEDDIEKLVAEIREGLIQALSKCEKIVIL
jgi:hypothetical protein